MNLKAWKYNINYGKLINTLNFYTSKIVYIALKVC